jgi:hypothetical protein
MRELCTHLPPDTSREKVLIRDCPELGRPTGNQVRTHTIYSGITNSTDQYPFRRSL